MIEFLADESLHGRVVVQLRRHHPEIDILTVHEVGLLGADDETILEWASANRRVVITSDERTMIGFAYDRVRKGLAMPGLVYVAQHLSIGVALRDLNTIDKSRTSHDLRDAVLFLPL